MTDFTGSDGYELLGTDSYVLTDGQDNTNSFTWQQTLLAQFANSPIILAIINSFSSAADQTVNVEAFYDNVWNIATAEGYGLDVWGRIVNISRSINLPGASVQLSDTIFRSLIMLKAAANIGSKTAGATNALLQGLFPGRGVCYVNDYGKMLLVYVFLFELEVWEQAMLTQSGILPRPSGVGAFTLQMNPPARFGFKGTGCAGFGVGTFQGSPISAS